MRQERKWHVDIMDVVFPKAIERETVLAKLSTIGFIIIKFIKSANKVYVIYKIENTL